MSVNSNPSSRRRSRVMAAPVDLQTQRAAQREILRHHISRIKNRCTVPELAKPDSRTALALRLVLFADALLQGGMLGNIEDLTGSSIEVLVRNCLRPAFLGDARQVERALQVVSQGAPADQLAFCNLLADVGWRLFDGDENHNTPGVRAG